MIGTWVTKNTIFLSCSPKNSWFILSALEYKYLFVTFRPMRMCDYGATTNDMFSSCLSIAARTSFIMPSAYRQNSTIAALPNKCYHFCIICTTFSLILNFVSSAKRNLKRWFFSGSFVKICLNITALYGVLDLWYAGIVAEVACAANKQRVLVFFDDGFAQYLPLKKIHKVHHKG